MVQLHGALAGYIMLAILWAFIYSFVEESFTLGSFRFEHVDATDPHAFYRLLYFSFTTQYSRLWRPYAVTDQARSFAMIEQFAGVFFVGVLIARLAGLYPPQKKRTVVQRIALHWVRVWQRYPRRYMMEYRASGIRLR
jgi:hypothetical protein